MEILTYMGRRIDHFSDNTDISDGNPPIRKIHARKNTSHLAHELVSNLHIDEL